MNEEYKEDQAEEAAQAGGEEAKEKEIEGIVGEMAQDKKEEELVL